MAFTQQNRIRLTTRRNVMPCRTPALVIAVVVLAWCSAFSEMPKAPAWQPLFKGIECAQVQRAPPEPLAVYAVRIDLAEPSLRFLVTPSNGDRPLETDGCKTSTFLAQHKCQLAVNASPFAPARGAEGVPRDILGLSISRGDVCSGAHGQNAAMLIGRDNKVWFSGPPFDTEQAYNAVGGFGMLLEEGKNVGGDGERHPRTAAGVSQDCRYLYLVVIDGRQNDYSVGATTAETADWLKRFGAYNALNLDGGGSTALVMSDGHGPAKLLNRPIHNHLPGAERATGNHLGVFAAPLD